MTLSLIRLVQVFVGGALCNAKGGLPPATRRYPAIVTTHDPFVLHRRSGPSRKSRGQDMVSSTGLVVEVLVSSNCRDTCVRRRRSARIRDWESGAIS
jgi:hypothetical protein